MAHGRVLWLDAMTHEGECISIINIHQATAHGTAGPSKTREYSHSGRNEKVRRAAENHGRGLEAATSRTGYSISTKSHFEKVDNQFQFIQRTEGSLIQSEGYTSKDLMGSASLDDIKSATLYHIITWNFSNDDTAEMPAPKSTMYWVGTCANNHALISCTIDEQLLSYQDPWARDPGDRP